MIKNAILGLCSFIFAAGLACGNAPDLDDSQGIEQTDDDGELGVGQEQLSVFSPQWGISTAGSHNSCNNTSSSQVCSVLSHAAAVTYCYGNGIADSDLVNFDFAMGRINQGQTKFQFSRVFFSGSASQNRANCEAASAVNAELKIRGNSTCSGSASGTSVTNFTCLALGSLTLLSESPATPGSWNKHSQGGITVDYPDYATLAASSTPAQVACVKMHGLMHSAEAYAGIGGQQTSVNFIASSNDINPKTVSPQLDVTGCNYLFLSSREQCEANSYSTTNPNLWGFSGATCP